MDHVMTGVREAAIHDAHARRTVTDADDVREMATEAEVDAAYEVLRGIAPREWARWALNAAFEVRPRGTVTDAEVAEAKALRQFAAELTAPGPGSLFGWAAPARAWMLAKADELEAAAKARRA